MLLFCAVVAVTVAAAAATVRGDEAGTATADAVYEAISSRTSTVDALSAGLIEDGVASETVAALLALVAGQSDGAQQVLAELTDSLAAGNSLERRAAHHDVVRAVMQFHEANRAVPRGTAAAYQNASLDLVMADASATARKRALVPGLLDDVADGPLANLLRTLLGQENVAPTKQRKLLRRAAPLECVNGDGERTPTADGRCEVEDAPKRSGSYVYSVAQSRRNVFYSTVNDALCSLDIPFLGFECPKTEADRTFMQRFGDGCCTTDGPPLDVTPEALLERGITNTVFGAIECTYRKNLAAAKWSKGASRFCMGITAAFDQPLTFEPWAVLYDGDTGDVLEIRRIEALVNVRSSLVHEGRMFFGGAQPLTAFGGVLEWLPTQHYAMQFRLVADFDGVASTVSSLTFHEGRLYAATLSSLEMLAAPLIDAIGDQPTVVSLLNLVKPGAVMASPPIKRVRKASSTQWTKVFDTCQYDPNPFVCRLSSFGAIETHRNELYFATRNLIFSDIFSRLLVCAQVVVNADGSANDVCDAQNADQWISTTDGGRTACDFCTDGGIVSNIVATLRATSLFRASNFLRGPAPTIELLYGYYAFIDNDLSLDQSPFVPQHGLAGYNNLFNAITYQLESVGNDHLWAGTWDGSTQINTLVNTLLGIFVPVQLELGTPGGDLFALRRTRLSFNAESLDGFGNALNLGFTKLEPLKCFTAANGDVDDPNTDFLKFNDDNDFTDDDDTEDTVPPTTTDDADDDTQWSLLVGTANPFSVAIEGGWELHCLQ